MSEDIYKIVNNAKAQTAANLEAYSRIRAIIDPGEAMTAEEVVAEVERVWGKGRTAQIQRIIADFSEMSEEDWEWFKYHHAPIIKRAIAALAAASAAAAREGE